MNVRQSGRGIYRRLRSYFWGFLYLLGRAGVALLWSLVCRAGWSAPLFLVILEGGEIILNGKGSICSQIPTDQRKSWTGLRCVPKTFFLI